MREATIMKSLVASELFVVTAHHFRVATRDGIAIERDEGIVAGATSEFLADQVAGFDEGLEDFEFDGGPVGFLLGVAIIDAKTPGLITGIGDAGAEGWGINEGFGIAQAIRPFGKTGAGDGGALAGLGGVRRV
jgi:hypothetical protein